jgi:hypothetical protein
MRIVFYLLLFCLFNSCTTSKYESDGHEEVITGNSDTYEIITRIDENDYYEIIEERNDDISDDFIPDKIEKDSGKYWEFMDIILSINEAYDSMARMSSWSLIYDEKIEFINNALLKFFKTEESIYFDIEKTFPFIKTVSSDDGIMTIYSWSKEDRQMRGSYYWGAAPLV